MSKLSRLTDEFGNVPKLISTTVGAVTINTISGQCILASGATTVVVTNSQVTATSLIFATLAAADANATVLKSCTAAAGSFTITIVTAPAANLPINFLVIN